MINSHLNIRRIYASTKRIPIREQAPDDAALRANHTLMIQYRSLANVALQAVHSHTIHTTVLVTAVELE